VCTKEREGGKRKISEHMTTHSLVGELVLEVHDHLREVLFAHLRGVQRNSLINIGFGFIWQAVGTTCESHRTGIVLVLVRWTGRVRCADVWCNTNSIGRCGRERRRSKHSTSLIRIKSSTIVLDLRLIHMLLRHRRSTQLHITRGIWDRSRCTFATTTKERWCVTTVTLTISFRPRCSSDINTVIVCTRRQQRLYLGRKGSGWRNRTTSGSDFFFRRTRSIESLCRSTVRTHQLSPFVCFHYSITVILLLSRHRLSRRSRTSRRRRLLSVRSIEPLTILLERRRKNRRTDTIVVTLRTVELGLLLVVVVDIVVVGGGGCVDVVEGNVGRRVRKGVKAPAHTSFFKNMV